jgi:hypothetical protein
VLNEAAREDVSELLWAGFNRMFPPESARAGEEWARVQWYEPLVALNHIQAESADGRFVVEFGFTDDYVSVSYSGPVRFSLAVVQPATRHLFTREEIFRTADGDWAASEGRFWPANEVQVLAGVIEFWANFVGAEDQDIREGVHSMLRGGFNRLLMMLPAVGEEAHGHAADEQRWREVRWRPMEAAGASGVQELSECGNFVVRWQFRETLGQLEAVISWSGPMRFVRRWPRRPDPPRAGEDGVFEARHGPWPPQAVVCEEFETGPGDWPAGGQAASFWPLEQAELLVSTLLFQSASRERWAAFAARAPQALDALAAMLFVGFRSLMRHAPVSGDDIAAQEELRELDSTPMLPLEPRRAADSLRADFVAGARMLSESGRFEVRWDFVRWPEATLAVRIFYRGPSVPFVRAVPPQQGPAQALPPAPPALPPATPAPAPASGGAAGVAGCPEHRIAPSALGCSTSRPGLESGRTRRGRKPPTRRKTLVFGRRRRRGC